MTKLMNLRVVVATDDDVDMKDIKPRLAALIRAAGTDGGENGSDAGRIYWITANVLQGPDARVNPRRPAAKKAVLGQGELA